MGQVNHFAKRISPFALRLRKKQIARELRIKGLRLSPSLARRLMKQGSFLPKKRRFTESDRSTPEIQGADAYCLNQSFRYQSLEEKHMREQTIPEQVVLWKIHSPEKVTERLAMAGEALKKVGQMDQKVEDLRKAEEKKKEKPAITPEEWRLLQKPDADRQFKVAAITPYK